jgi:hypothetical protein
MFRSLLAMAVTIGLALLSGCSRQPTAPVQNEGASHLDRLKNAKSAANAKAKDKAAPQKTGAGGAKAKTGTNH